MLGNIFAILSNHTILYIDWDSFLAKKLKREFLESKHPARAHPSENTETHIHIFIEKSTSATKVVAIVTELE